MRAAERLHFGAAADDLHVTQQALSKRVRRLEDALAVQLFVRGPHRVAMTPAGQRFLPRAREILAAADSAVREVGASSRALRVDVLDDRLGSAALLGRVAAADPDLRVEVSMRRSLAAAMAAIERGEIDAALGRVCGVGRPWPVTLDQRVVRLEPLAVLVGIDHPMARREALTPADLTRVGVWVPDPGSAAEWGSYLSCLASHFGFGLRSVPPAASLADLVALIHASRTEVTLIGADMPLPGSTGLRAVPLVDPTPVYPWSLVWPRHPHPLAGALLPRLLAAGGPSPRPARPTIWLPEQDRAAATRVRGGSQDNSPITVDF
ncbi:MAG: LysR family transcriptional regulator [Actinobacteria bacterium]|nr:LysR family transcriptional regulator [Actinomycetota bacterium]